uniref:Uncharacterized protein n=1 Tax=Sarcophilus harrisii TaxID=9305 RepID=A0A7N4PUY2_SARHA
MDFKDIKTLVVLQISWWTRAISRLTLQYLKLNQAHHPPICTMFSVGITIENPLRRKRQVCQELRRFWLSMGLLM